MGTPPGAGSGRSASPAAPLYACHRRTTRGPAGEISPRKRVLKIEGECDVACAGTVGRVRPRFAGAKQPEWLAERGKKKAPGASGSTDWLSDEIGRRERGPNCARHI